MTKRLFVGGLPYSVTSQQLNEMFVPFGAVTSSNVITDKFTGNSKGFGFVEFEDDKAADEAVKKLNETEVGGRKITVNVARPMEERGPRNFDNDRRGGFDRRGGDRGDRRGGFRGGNR
ncbi:MAG: RNP-1 like protein RNA-binding protein [Candidatus Woesebacteria bacterium GW2011_GWC1_38_13]|uniref:RNA-binding protein n=3 Tax=Candidatus Woeseibacteriota TaxID=1752722 RepID=A0A0G0N7J4_9BACT|nr:MAG: RNA-binding protein [Candidatus Woesebacteria bacterium GW2011_GWD1_38_10]KKQ54768.1 MAG: RNP-1 like protein RNA-binding protein [Candidatus Woesebacteria bacterium GW2011_GWC1_38_13]KKQ81874.1 MAG: RNA-binding protein [Candidatus Woesebacteria bacterium GW2011_GWA1_38_8]